MKIQDTPPLHLTYCLNVHPGETWAENRAAITEGALAVRRLVRPGGPFGLGLRLSARASETLDDPRELRDFAAFQADNGLYTFTINGFPYGLFHGSRVKQDVYRPDWTEPLRRDYTIRLANILAQLLPEGMSGSISTVPGSYRDWITDAEQVRQMSRMLADTAMHLDRIRQATGRRIRLALEPEPDCFIETTHQCAAFITGSLLRDGQRHLKSAYGVDERTACELLLRCVGVCFDTAHLAVEFEDVPASLNLLAGQGIAVAKVQLSAALSMPGGPAAASDLGGFVEGVYLHQVKARRSDGSIASYRDLPEAISAAGAGGADVDEWRVHFHVPLFWGGSGRWRSTAWMLDRQFADLVRGGLTEHLEIETYTFGVLPEHLRQVSLAQSIAEEYRWTLRMLQ